MAIAWLALPPAAGAARGSDPVITVTAGGDRTGDTSVSGLAGVTFDFYAGVAGTPPTGGPVASCVTGADGRCSVDVPARGGGTGAALAGYWVVQAAVPSGWFASTYLDTGGATSVTRTNYSRLFVGNVTANVSVPIPTTNNAATATARGSVWAASRDNPPLPDTCGLRVALLFDLSGSIGGNIGALRSAGTSFVDALTGTPSSVGVYTFASFVPANTTNNSTLELTSVATPESAATVNAKINGLTVATGAAAGTNWDQGLWQIAADPTQYNVAIVLTDGNPTFYAPTAMGPGNYTRFIEVENGIFSANALKAKGTTVLGVGIGAVGDSVDNLASISGPREGTDFFATDFADLGPLLRELALRTCEGTVNVVKQVVPASAPGDLSAAVPAPGWQFSASPDTVRPQIGVTDENGAVSFATDTTSTEPVTLTETEQEGYQLIEQDGKNASCRNSAGEPVPVTNAPSGPGFTVDAVASEAITCLVYNQELAGPDPASVVVNKSWDIDGVTLPNGDQNPNFQASLVLDPVHPPDAEPVWGEEFHGYLAGDEVTVGEDARIPPGCTNVSSGDLGTHELGPGLNTFHVTNTVRCDTRLTLLKRISNPYPGATLPPLTSWTLSARTMAGEPPVIEGTTGVTGSVSAGTRYVLAETSVPGFVQYVQPGSILADGATGSWECTQVDGGREDYDGGDGTIVVQPGEHVACTAVNIPQPATLTLVKHVFNEHGGTAEPTDWTLTGTPEESAVPPGPTLSGVTGSPGVTGVTIPPGVPYSLTEAGPPGYQLAGLDCVITGTHDTVPLSGDTLTAGIGEDITCTFTNVQSAPTPPPTPTPKPTRPPKPYPRPPYPRPTYPIPSGAAPTGDATGSGGSGLLIGGGLAIAALRWPVRPEHAHLSGQHRGVRHPHRRAAVAAHSSGWWAITRGSRPASSQPPAAAATGRPIRTAARSSHGTGLTCPARSSCQLDANTAT
jgi:hypothetical protein